MNYQMIRYVLGMILLIEAALLAIPMLVALSFGESVMPFLITMGIMLILSLPSVLFKPRDMQIYAKEGFVTVAAGWILMSLLGALPFVFGGTIPNYIDAFFETVSGFTTTGASILPAVEHLPRGILFWRSFTHWIGGMGVLVFVLAIMPSGGGQTIHLMRAEVPGPTKGKLVPKMRQTAIILYGIYFVLTLALALSLCLCKMPIYDAVVHALATAGTGGFSVMNNSIAGYNNPAAEWVIATFMVIFAINFNLYFFILIKNAREALQSEELRVFLLLVVAATTAIAINTAQLFLKTGDCIRSAFFQVASIVSTTGYSSVDFNLWPSLSKTVLILLMVTGACAGSTAGGLKISRVIILVKSMFREVRHMLRPHSVNVVRLDKKALPDETVRAATSYLTIYVGIFILAVLMISVDNFSFETNFTAALSCLNNIGPALGSIGPLGNLSGYSYFSKIVLSIAMLFGRLEIMPMIILFAPATWRRGKFARKNKK